MGARPLRRAIQRYIEDPLADFVLRSQVPEGSTVLDERDENAGSAESEGDGEAEVKLSVVEPAPKPTPVGVGAEGAASEGEEGESHDTPEPADSGNEA
jgi:ATP-dependent Clp protease ATP-binding subunit ClpC